MIKKSIFFLVFSLALSFSLFAETILLKSGKSIEAKIIERTDKYIKIDLEGVSLTYYREDIESIDGIPFSQKKENLSLSPATPVVSSSLSIDTTQLRSLLKDLGYPKQSLPALEKELLNFLNKIDFPFWKAQLQEAKTNPHQLKDLLRQMGKLIKKELSSTSGIHPLLLALVNSLSQEDILSLIETSPISLEEKEKNKQATFSCSAYSQLGSIILSLIGLQVKVALAPEHVFNYLRLNAQQALLVDFTNQIFELIELKDYYETKGAYLVLKPQEQLSAKRVKEIREQFRQLPPEECKFTQKEILNLGYFYLSLTENFSATASLHINRGDAYADKGDLIQALADYNQALQLNPNYAEAYNNRGDAYADKGDLNQAIADFNQALQVNPNSAEAYNNRGLAYANKGDLNQAIADFNQALQLNLNDALAYYNRGLAYVKKGDLNQAFADFNQALQLNPNFALAYNNRALVYFIKGDYSKAWEDVQKAEALGYAVNPEFLQKLRRAIGKE